MFMPPLIQKIEPGDVIGRCRTIRELGRGGVGTVYLATHQTLQIESERRHVGFQLLFRLLEGHQHARLAEQHKADMEARRAKAEQDKADALKQAAQGTATTQPSDAK